MQLWGWCSNVPRAASHRALCLGTKASPLFWDITYFTIDVNHAIYKIEIFIIGRLDISI